MYLRCSGASKPAWNGNSRALFQNNANHRPARTSRRIRSRQRARGSLEAMFHSKVATEAIAKRIIQKGQIFLIAPNVDWFAASKLPGPGVFGATASAAGRHEEPAYETSQLWSVRKFSWSVAKVS